MFKLNPSPTFKAKVAVPVPGGKPQEIEFEFRHRTVTEFDEWAKSQKGETPDYMFVMDMAVGWSGVDAPFSEESAKTLCENYHGVAVAVWDAYRRELMAARLKN